MAKSQSCISCRYNSPHKDLPVDIVFCVRFPPSVLYTDQQGKAPSRFPTTKNDWWCGEYKAGPDAPEIV